MTKTQMTNLGRLSGYAALCRIGAVVIDPMDGHGRLRILAVSPGFPLIPAFSRLFPRFRKIFFSNMAGRGIGKGAELIRQSA
jgi:hypothetical protein